ncbi:MAG: XRE family transcriptional regulator [Thermodesulfobacteriota bacterium]|nr:XRE family transcriptional regulator [Thermodesulfobacteriota bacterium]
MNLGTVIRKKRKDLGLTLRVVALKAGISEGFLSQVENDVNSPSVDTLVRICSAMGVEAGDIIRQAQEQQRIVVIRKKEWGNVDLPASGFSTRRFFPPENRRVIDSSIITIEKSISIPVRKGVKSSQEVLCVLKGTVELVYGEETIGLAEGDTVHYWTLPENQKITNTESSRAVVLWVGTI